MGINGAALAKLFITLVDLTFLSAFARRLKAFSIRDCISGPLGKTILLSGGVFFTAFLIASLHAKVIVSLLLLTLCFALYVVLFWFMAGSEDDKMMIHGLFQGFFVGRGRKEVGATIQVSETDA
jgi:Flp pilus assembly protein TadB